MLFVVYVLICEWKFLCKSGEEWKVLKFLISSGLWRIFYYVKAKSNGPLLLLPFEWIAWVNGTVPEWSYDLVIIGSLILRLSLSVFSTSISLSAFLLATAAFASPFAPSAMPELAFFRSKPFPLAAF